MLRKIGWFFALWSASVLMVAVLAYGIRLFLV
jgi:hypothetical protein